MGRAFGGPFAGLSRNGVFALALACLAALRVAAFAGAFPFFSNVDEHRHIDAVLKYSHGYLPAPGRDAYEAVMPTWLGLYGSPEYHLRAEAAAGLPSWQSPMDRTLGMIAYNERFLAGRPNLEAFSPPVYYATAGAWMALGRALGLDGGILLYWVRGLAAGIYFGLVLAAYRFCASAYPGDSFCQLGVPLLLAVFPQDALYYITPDALSPALGAATLFAGVALARDPRSPGWIYAAAGLLAALAFLTKYTNVTALALCGLATLVVVRRGVDRAGWRKLAALWLCAAIPIAVWLGRNALVHGDWLATGSKLARLGWGVNPLSGFFAHPIWSPSGLWIFVSELLPTFWRGELAWHRTTLVSPLADDFYLATSLLFLAAAALGWALRPNRNLADGFGLAALAISAAVLAGLSMRFAFGATTNPTAANPYLSQGRLVSGALVPFALVYVRGIRSAVSIAPVQLQTGLAWLLLVVVVGVVAVSETALSRVVFASEFNWFHYP